MSVSDASVLAQLRALSLHEKPTVRQMEHSLPSTTLTSWKMNEHLYAKAPCPFPTLARGLFTSGDTIFVRGYDKFFNVDEVPWTAWPSVEKYTTGPYVLSYKENGCIIFIAATSPSELVVTSKHALGPPSQQGREQGVVVSHAQMGEKWLAEHLSRSGRTAQELADVLYSNQWTAVAELCDDEFEEHVLGYPAERSGLHLHGLNKNVAEFQTEAFDVVQKLAHQFGFIRTRSVVKDSLEDVKGFIQSVEREGTIDGEPIEGFVVRCQINDVAKDAKVMPYPPQSTFFFKVKFDEPYLMYREWREITRGLLSKHSEGKLGNDEGGVRRSTYPDSVLYRDWVRGMIRDEPKLFENFGRSKGIIALRERFLAELQGDVMQTKLRNVRESWGKKQTKNVKPTKPLKDDRQFEKIMLVPIAVPGCGKTAVSMTLAKLYNFAHTQSDDVKTKKTGPTFEKNVVECLKGGSRAVIADRNNHMRQHRERLNVVPFEQKPPLGRVRMIALYWPIDSLTLNTVIRVCSERVQRRGMRHQSLRPDGGQSHEDIIVNFVNQFEFFDKERELFDDVVQLDLEDDLATSTTKVIAGLREAGVDLKTVTQERFNEVLEEVRDYNPEYKRPDDQNGMKKKVEKGAKALSGPRYFAVGVECKLGELCGGILKGEGVEGDKKQELSDFLHHLVSHDRIANVPHITLLHQKEMDGSGQMRKEYEECWSMFSTTTQHIDFKFGVDALVFNERVMALSLSGVSVVGSVDESVKSMVEGVMQKKVLHITVGTRDATVNPFESKAVVEKWKKGSEEVYGYEVRGVELGGRLRGMF